MLRWNFYDRDRLCDAETFKSIAVQHKAADIRQFRGAESAFVHSEKGKRKFSETGNLSDDEARKLEKIAEKTKSHAKEYRGWSWVATRNPCTTVPVLMVRSKARSTS